jgi:hypothetical protein
MGHRQTQKADTILILSMSAAAIVAPLSTPESDIALVDAISRTISYADRFDQAISGLDVIRYLDIPARGEDVLRTLADRSGGPWLSSDGLYYLPGRFHLVACTLQKAARAKSAWLSARRWAALMAHVPFVRMIAVTGSLAMSNMRPGADIDYLVVTAPRRVWLTRLFLIAIVRLARIFRQDLCPNYLLSTRSVLIEERTLFTARELAQMVPLYGVAFYRQMMSLNSWALKYLPAAGTPPPAPPEVSPGVLARSLKRLLEAVLFTHPVDRLESWEMKRKIARLRLLPGAEAPSVVLTPEQCKGHFKTSEYAPTAKVGF